MGKAVKRMRTIIMNPPLHLTHTKGDLPRKNCPLRSINNRLGFYNPSKNWRQFL